MKRITYLAVVLPVLLISPPPLGQGRPVRVVAVAPPPPANNMIRFQECEGTLVAGSDTTLNLAASVHPFPPYGPAPTRFAIGPELASGEDYTPKSYGFHPTLQVKAWEYSYRLRDIQIGDRLRVLYSRVNGMDVCYQICIHRRPGGRVPPMPGKRRSYVAAEYHNVVSWMGECEAKGLPWPYPPVPELPPEERDPNAKPSAQ